jgi:hypothetical protein
MDTPPDIKAALSDRYVIDREIGAGGMAVVYLAHDRKLERDVALKVLRPELGAVLGAERFLAEIKISARLDHPHILTLIDSGDADGTLFYVLPYVRGESLRDKLKREHQLPLDEALAITRQVASALDYAHRQGLVHRDIKPENILLQEGLAMLTDFGIALAVKEAGGMRLTQTGLSLGTPQYMSPEQATGDRGVDIRSDVYSLAAVLYEMLAGEPPVGGGSAQAMIAKLMTEKPTRVRVIRDTVPLSVDNAIDRALSKTPADRFATAEDFVRALEAPAETETGASKGKGKRGLLAAAAAVVALAGGAGAWALLGGGSTPETRATLGQKTQLTVAGGVRVPAISPDGKQLAYLTRQCDGGHCTYSVVVQDVGGTTTRDILDGATAAYYLGWSPDRRNLLFNGTVDSRYGTYMLSALGGTPRFLTSGVAAFYAGGDSLLMGSSDGPDSEYWMRVAGLDGIVKDSIRVPGPGQSLASISVVPGTQWILTLVIQAPHGLWQVIDRSGKVIDHVVNACTCGGIATRDAVWLDRAGDAVGESIVRISLDRKTGKLGTRQDTMITGLFTNVSLTDDGANMVMDEGTLDYNVWSLDLADALKGSLPKNHHIAQASSAVFADVSPDGERLLISRVVPTGGGHTERRYSVASFGGGSEKPIGGTGTMLGAGWADSTTLVMVSRAAGRVRLALADATTGAERSVLELPDSTIGYATPLSDGWAWINTAGDSVVVRQGDKTRALPRPKWYGRLFQLEKDPAGDRLFFLGFNAATGDTLGLSTMNLADGSTEQWAAEFAEWGTITPLSGGGVLFAVDRTQESKELLRVDGPGKIRSLGTPPIPLQAISVSADLKRATVVQRDYRADAWMYQVNGN